jgi:hypothetical protein
MQSNKNSNNNIIGTCALKKLDNLKSPNSRPNFLILINEDLVFKNSTAE